MAASFNTILIIGGTSGIGEAFARRFHSMGKSLILTGRRSERLRQLENELPGTKGHEWDFSNLAEIPHRLDQIFADHPKIDTVWVNGGIMTYNSIKDINSVTDETINTSVTTNLTAPMVIAHHVIPRFLAAPTKPASFLITTSGTAFMAVPFATIYASTKAGLHYYTAGLRQQLKDTHVNVIEIVPPMVGTDALHHAARAGGAESSTGHAMPMEDYVKESFAILEGTEARELKEVAAGSAAKAVKAWREGTGAFLDGIGYSDSKSS